MGGFGSRLADTEEDVQEQAISLVRNLVTGDLDSVEQIFSDGGILFQAVEKQLVNPSPAISLQVRSYAAISFSIIRYVYLKVALFVKPLFWTLQRFTCLTAVDN